jgi:hypothetical protein
VASPPSGGAKALESQALVHAVWGVCHMDGVQMSEAHREAGDRAHIARVMVRGLGLGVRVLDLGCEVCDRVCAKGLGLRTTPNKG